MYVQYIHMYLGVSMYICICTPYSRTQQTPVYVPIIAHPVAGMYCMYILYCINSVEYCTQISLRALT